MHRGSQRNCGFRASARPLSSLRARLPSRPVSDPYTYGSPSGCSALSAGTCTCGAPIARYGTSNRTAGVAPVSHSWPRCVSSKFAGQAIWPTSTGDDGLTPRAKGIPNVIARFAGSGSSPLPNPRDWKPCAWSVPFVEPDAAWRESARRTSSSRLDWSVRGPIPGNPRTTRRTLVRRHHKRCSVAPPMCIFRSHTRQSTSPRPQVRPRTMN